ncbi:hypothetical protein NL676_021548 [Syzygium grande]|nr:hypothetical protein NL676_021548 [Syzygium grande]
MVIGITCCAKTVELRRRSPNYTNEDIFGTIKEQGVSIWNSPVFERRSSPRVYMKASVTRALNYVVFDDFLALECRSKVTDQEDESSLHTIAGDLRKGINKGWKISFDPSLKEPKGSEKGSGCLAVSEV